MNLTNAYDLPRAYERAIRETQRTHTPRTISITELLKPPRLRALELAHEAEISADVSDFLPQFFGTAVHAWLERWRDGTFAEQTLRVHIGDWTVTGTPDALEWYTVEGGQLIDWKTTTVRASQYERTEWVQQTNLYAGLAGLAGLPPVSEITIWAYLRDWDKGAMARDGAYPRSGIIRRDIPLWPMDEARAFLWKRLRLHREAQEDGALVDCTDEERWVRTTYAVTRAGKARPTRVFDTRAEADEFARLTLDPIQRPEDWYAVEERRAQPLRCQHWCPAAPWCSQWAREQDAMSLAELVAVE